MSFDPASATETGNVADTSVHAVSENGSPSNPHERKTSGAGQPGPLSREAGETSWIDSLSTDESDFLDRYPWSRFSTLCLRDRVSIYEYQAGVDLGQDCGELLGGAHTPFFQSRVLNLPVNYEVERGMQLFLSGKTRDRFQVWLGRSGRYLDIMGDIFRKEGVPDDLIYLSLIESGFNPVALSRMKASGPWQFMEGTGRRYGLDVDWWVDERRDPVKSAEAAARHLRDLYEVFGSWDLAMAAYNAGEGKIRKAVSRTGTDDFWKIQQTRHIRAETKEYVPRFVAASLIAQDPVRYGLFNIDYQEPYAYDEVVLSQPIDLTVAADLAGTTVEEIRDLNPELLRWATPPYAKNYTLKVPPGTARMFQERLAAYPPEELFTMIPFKARKGDTLAAIARAHGLPVSVLQNMNPGAGRGRLKTGQIIRIPADARLSKQPTPPAKAAVGQKIYRVQKGDTLYSIARRHGIDYRLLLKHNPQIHPKQLQVGDVIHIPGKSA